MKYQVNLIKSTLEGATIAAAAGVASMSGRVSIKMGEDELFATTNMGRLPSINIKQVTTDYQFVAEPDHQVTRTAEFEVKIIVPTFVNRSDTQFLLLEKIKVACISALTQTLSLGVTNIREDPAIVNQMTSQMAFKFTTETSGDEDYKEGT
jgi:hypothetical protein